MAETTEQYRNRINQLKTGIENEPYIKKMRENIAEGISKTGNRQADIEDQFQEVIDNTTGKDVISAPELIAARNGETNLKTRLDKEQQQVNAQLAQKVGMDYLEATLSLYSGGGVKDVFYSLNALKTMHPNGAMGPMLVYDTIHTDGAHQYTWVSGEWKDIGLYNPQGIADYTVTKDKLAFTALEGIESRNLFNKNTVTAGTFLNTVNGLLNASAAYFTSDYIKVRASTTYSLSSAVTESLIVVFFDANKNYISGLPWGTKLITTPANCKYVRISNVNSQINNTQFEIGTTATPYEEFGTFVKEDSVREKTFIEKHMKFPVVPGRPSKNLFNKATVSVGKYIDANGNLGDVPAYFTSDFIPVVANENYTITAEKDASKVAFYDIKKAYISQSLFGAVNHVTPSNAVYARISATNNYVDKVQFEKGTEQTHYSSFGVKVLPEALELPKIKNTILYTLRQAFVAWQNNEKFPVMFFGDSTTDGANTTGNQGHQNADDLAGGTGKADHQPPNAYTTKLQETIRKETKSTVARIYNGGYSGTSLREQKSKLNQILGSVYADTKMLGIGHGINDRLLYTTEKQYETEFKADLLEVVDYCYSKNIQPFMVTTQAVSDASNSTSAPLKTSENVNSIANRLKYEVAEMYGLEVIDLNTFGQLLMEYSQYSLNEIISDKLHFGDIGHKKEAEFLFTHFCPRTISVDKGDLLTFTSQEIKTDVATYSLIYLNSFEDGFKVKANHANEDGGDVLIQDFWIYNGTNSTLNLKAFVTDVNDQYVLVNDARTDINENGQSVGNLDIGTYHIQAYSGVGGKVDFKGFKVE